MSLHDISYFTKCVSLKFLILINHFHSFISELFFLRPDRIKESKLFNSEMSKSFDETRLKSIDIF